MSRSRDRLFAESGSDSAAATFTERGPGSEGHIPDRPRGHTKAIVSSMCIVAPPSTGAKVQPMGSGFRPERAAVNIAASVKSAGIACHGTESAQACGFDARRGVALSRCRTGPA